MGECLKLRHDTENAARESQTPEAGAAAAEGANDQAERQERSDLPCAEGSSYEENVWYGSTLWILAHTGPDTDHSHLHTQSVPMA